MGYQPFDTVQALFSRAAIAVVPSVWEEPLGRVAIEALAGGCALVTSGRGGLAEIVNDDCAAVCAPTVQALRATLETLIAHPELRHQLSRNAIDRAKAYDLMAVTRDLDEARATIVALHEARHA
jgi:glycosyltransferase involved in cell wall biosynthesis